LAVGALALAALAGWLIVRSNREWNGALARLRSEPGIVLVSAERDWGRWTLSGLRDPLAADPARLLASLGVDTARVAWSWEPYHSAHPRFVRARANSPARDLVALQRAVHQERVLFPVGSAQLDDAAREAATRVAGAIGRLDSATQAAGARLTVVLEGRSDATGSDAANTALSRLRVEAVREVLGERGVAPAALELRALGSTSPLAGDSGSRASINRSVSFEVRVE
jgi:outer membrane protein OmpA-like peptidoglycan-associated protein